MTNRKLRGASRLLVSSIAVASISLPAVAAPASPAGSAIRPSRRVANSATSASPGGAVVLRMGTKEGLAIESGGQLARVELHVAGWFRFESEILEGQKTTPRFLVPLIRPYIDARFWSGWLRAFVQPELAGADGRLLDAFVEVGWRPELKLRLGQFRTPFSRSFINPIISLQLPDRGAVVDRFRLGRDTGIMLLGTFLGGSLEYYGGIFNGARINDFDGDVQGPLLNGRIVYNVGHIVPYDQVPAADRSTGLGVAVGLGGAYRRRGLPVDAMEPGAGTTEESWHGGADLAAMAGPFSGLAEAFVRTSRSEGARWASSRGAFVQAGAFVMPRTLELATRLGVMDTAADEPSGLRESAELGLNFYMAPHGRKLGHHLKASLRYGFDHTDASFVDGAVVENRHRFTLQLQSWL